MRPCMRPWLHFNPTGATAAHSIRGPSDLSSPERDLREFRHIFGVVTGGARRQIAWARWGAARRVRVAASISLRAPNAAPDAPHSWSPRAIGEYRPSDRGDELLSPRAMGEFGARTHSDSTSPTPSARTFARLRCSLRRLRIPGAFAALSSAPAQPRIRSSSVSPWPVGSSLQISRRIGRLIRISSSRPQSAPSRRHTRCRSGSAKTTSRRIAAIVLSSLCATYAAIRTSCRSCVISCFVREDNPEPYRSLVARWWSGAYTPV
jgi:hypothetical protein